DGVVSILVKIEENEEYGNVEVKKTINWGLPNMDDMHTHKRELWSSLAPLWMVITLIVLMAGVYSQFAVIAYKLFKIKRV
ncbi:MAG: hypothetical protein HQ522_11155, partial [Bacteroidetes bacterium]|nr:hypothetical protein [Bacteroidota bacterium]